MLKPGIIFKKEENILKEIRSLQPYLGEASFKKDSEVLSNALIYTSIQLDNLHRLVEKLIKK